jgi:hypothetical protein
MDSPQTAWKRNHDNVAKFQQLNKTSSSQQQQQQQKQQQQQQQPQNQSSQQRGVKMGTASLSKSSTSQQQQVQQQQHQQVHQHPVPSVRKQPPQSPLRDPTDPSSSSSSKTVPIKLPPKTKINQRLRDQQPTLPSKDIYKQHSEDEDSETGADEVGGYYRNKSMIRFLFI